MFFLYLWILFVLEFVVGFDFLLNLVIILFLRMVLEGIFLVVV